MTEKTLNDLETDVIERTECRPAHGARGGYVERKVHIPIVKLEDVRVWLTQTLKQMGEEQREFKKKELPEGSIPAKWRHQFVQIDEVRRRLLGDTEDENDEY